MLSVVLIMFWDVPHYGKINIHNDCLFIGLIFKSSPLTQVIPLFRNSQ